MKHLTLVVACALVLLCSPRLTNAQDTRRDKGVFVEPKNEFYEEIKSKAEAFKKKDQPRKKEFRMDLSTVKAPASPAEFTQCWHTPPISQGISGMCWCFSATSYFESEIHRLTKRQIKLSELYTVYWEYVEKARRFVQEHGDSEFGEGSEANAVPRMWKKYGIVPAEAYTGKQPGQEVHDHTAMYQEMRDYLTSVKKNHGWDEEGVLTAIRSILDHYLGAPPSTVMVEGKSMTPKEYLEKVVRLNLDDYVDFMSLMEKPYYQKVELVEPDNWWHSAEYYNIPLDEFMGILKRALRKGYSVAIGGDTSEPGYEGHAGVGVIPSFDIASASIDENARQFRWSNHTTTDDHGIHAVGYTEKDGKDWYLIKDSGSGSRNNGHPGYYFYHEDYVKLKMLGFTVHRDVAEEILKKCGGAEH
jgi:bleomycin hydrolase